MKTLKSKISLVAKVSLVLILLGFFGKKSKADRTSHQEPATIEAKHQA